MKTILRMLAIGFLLAAADPARAVVGYYNYHFAQGENFFHNNLLASDNHVAAILHPPTLSAATLSLWDVNSRQFVEAAYWDGMTWLDGAFTISSLQLLPGTGARLWVSDAYVETFVGGVITRDGRPLTGDPFDFGTATPPPPGVYCLGDKAPLGGGDAFQRVIGRAPAEGEQIIYSNGTTLTGPAARIITPVSTTQFAGGSTLSYSGEAFDFVEAPLPASALTWTIELHTNGQSGAVFGPWSGSSSNYTVPSTGPLTTNMFYRFKLLAADGFGFERQTSLSVGPQLRTVTFETIPAGLELTLDGVALPHAGSTSLVSGFQRTVSAPSPQALGGTNFNFVLWSDGGAQTHQVQAPFTNATLAASFVLPALAITNSMTGIDITWPAWAQSLDLYSTTNLAMPGWILEPTPPVAADGMLKVTISAGGTRFYRLQ